MKTLIVNADEFGFTHHINKAIIEAHVDGIVTSTTMMVNMYAFEDAIILARRHSKLGVGLHFNLTYGRPASEKSASLTNTEGNFFSRFQLIKRLILGKARLSEVENEFEAQLAKFKNSGLQPSHFDSHQNIHLLPWIFPIFLRLAIREQVPIRLALDNKIALFEPQVPLLHYPFVLLQTRLWKRLIRVSISRMYQILLSSNNVKTTDHFLSIDMLYGRDNNKSPDILNKYISLLRMVQNGSNEIMCHPGYVDSKLISHCPLTFQREHELKALINPILKTIISDKNIKLITFREL